MSNSKPLNQSEQKYIYSEQALKELVKLLAKITVEEHLKKKSGEEK